MPFSVKATYGRSGELRKLTFPGQSFPTYDQLYNQLYRVFPISHNYYLSTLLFTPDSSNSKSSVLLGQEIHNAEEYKACILSYAHCLYSTNAMLRFTVFDETPHKLPAGFVPAAENTGLAPLNGGSAPNPFISVSHIPPPPIILSSASALSASMDVDATSRSYSPSSTSTPIPQHHSPQSAAGSCCAVSESKVEIQGIVSKFKEDLDRIIKSSFATPAPTPLPPVPSFIPPMMPSVAPSSFCLFKYCTTCAKIFQGPWFACDKCSIVVCPGCHETQSSTFCVSAMAPHIMKKEFCAACPVETQAPRMSVGPTPWPAWQQPGPAQLQGYSPIYPFQMQPQITPFVPVNELPRAPAAAAPLPPLPVPSVAQVPTASAPPAPPVIHRGVLCDMCDSVVEGIRHKCLDCPDYDLCTRCIESGSAERHNPFHEFLEIKEPGRVIVHTVYSGDGERDAPLNTSATRAPAPAPQAEVQPAVHYATCNLCDSRIRGDRYKCADCPDFDTCSNCFSITREQHPHHAFVKLATASDYIRRENPTPAMHFVTCDGCSKAIYGTRYKCMHPECPDFDLCEGCEAFPISMHPDTHPLLKMRSPSTIVPTVYRVGQTNLINHEDAPRGRSPVAQPSRSRSSSFGPGFMSSEPNERRNTIASFFSGPPPFGNKPSFVPQPQFASPQPPFTVQPPSPFFFRSESSRSSSPVLAYQPMPRTLSPVMAYQPPPRSLSPTYAPRPSSPMMMPGGLYDEPAFARQPQPAYNGYLFNRPQPTASRFSHSPSPSLPSPPQSPSVRSRSPSPPAPVRISPWGVPVRAQTTHYDGHLDRFPSLRQQSAQWSAEHMQAVERQNQMVQEQLDREAREVEEEQQRKARDFWIAQDLAQADKMDQERREAVEQIADAQARLALHIEEEQMRWARAPAVPPPPPPPPAPVQEPASFPSYWPKSSEELRHLMQHDSEPVVDAFSRLSVQEELAEVMDSPLIGEALLNRPVASNSDFSRAHLELVREEAARVTSFNHSLAALLNGYDSETEPDKKDEEPLISITKEEPTPVPTPSIPDLPSVPVLAPAAPSLAPAAVPVPIPVPAPALGLRATFVNDLTLPDGQIFPPGAEFMKCWQMVNSGGVEWPAGTELVYVAGERLAREVGEPKNVPIGSVKVGAEVELWTGELKAPETPGRYVSYWRLRDGQGRLFGESIWIDINVTETLSNESSLSSSSIIVMPRGAQSVPTSSASASNVRGEVDEDELSEHGSDASSGSLISVPTSDDEEWASVPSEQPAEPQRYVVLYDDTSSQSSGSDIE